MLAVRTIAQVPLWALGPLVCRVRGHRWHVWSLYDGPIKVCVRCPFQVTDAQTRRGTR